MTNPSHETHDPVLIARFAADDVSDPERATAESLVASCADCASLAADLGAIMHATATSLPAIHSTRDFRLTPEKARSLQRPRWLRWLPDVSSAARMLQPVAGTAVAVGIAMALVTSGSLSVGGPTVSNGAPAYDTTVGSAPQAAAPTAAPAALPAPAASAAGPLTAVVPASVAPGASAASVFAAAPSPVAPPGASPLAGAQVRESPRAAGVHTATAAPAPPSAAVAAVPNGESQASGDGAGAGGGALAQNAATNPSEVVPGKAPASRQPEPASDNGIPVPILWLVVAVCGAVVFAGSWLRDRSRRSV